METRAWIHISQCIMFYIIQQKKRLQKNKICLQDWTYCTNSELLTVFSQASGWLSNIFPLSHWIFQTQSKREHSMNIVCSNCSRYVSRAQEERRGP